MTPAEKKHLYDLIDKRDALFKAMSNRQRVLLQDAEFQRLRQEHKQAFKELREYDNKLRNEP